MGTLPRASDHKISAFASTIVSTSCKTRTVFNSCSSITRIGGARFHTRREHLGPKRKIAAIITLSRNKSLNEKRNKIFFWSIQRFLATRYSSFSGCSKFKVFGLLHMFTCRAARYSKCSFCSIFKVVGLLDNLTFRATRYSKFSGCSIS